jgi:hypothetical protein
MLRSFTYLDTDVVDDFLAQLGTEPDRRSSGPSRFATLVEALRDRGELTYLDAATEVPWGDGEVEGGLMRGDVVEAEVVVRLGAADGVAGVLQAVGRLAPAVEGLGSGLGLDESARSLFQAFTSTAPGRVGGATWAAAALATDPTHRFAAELRHAKAVRSLDDLDGEATIVGKVRRFARSGEHPPLPGVTPAVVLTPIAIFR